VDNESLKRNNTAQPGCQLYLTKPLGIGILTTAEKQKKLKTEHARLARDTMCQLNKIGAELGRLAGVTAMTDVTGFGLLGHLLEMCEGSNVSARLSYNAVPKLPNVELYLQQGCSPGGAQRNFDSYGHKVGVMAEQRRKILCDPQTSGGLLVAIAPEANNEFINVCREFGLELQPIGSLLGKGDGPFIEVV
jgi:selenide,water dikinase